MTIDREKLLDYVVGAVTPEEEQQIAVYLNEHPTEAAWVRDMFETVTEVVLAQEPAAVPASAEAALLARIRTTPQRAAPSPLEPLSSGSRSATPQKLEGGTAPEIITMKRRSAPVWLSLAAAAIILVILIPTVLRPSWQGYVIRRELAESCAEAQVVCQPILTDTNQKVATIAKHPDNSLLVILEQKPPAGQVYQGWEIVDGTPQSLGVWEGRVMRIPQLKDSSTFGVSVEPAGGSPQPTSTPIVVFPLSG